MEVVRALDRPVAGAAPHRRARARSDDARRRDWRRRLRRRRVAPSPAGSSRRDRLGGHESEPGGEAGGRRAPAAAFPHRPARSRRSSPLDAARGADVVFLALEHGESSKPGDRASSRRVRGSSWTSPRIFASPTLSSMRGTTARTRPRQLLSRFRYGLADVEGDAASRRHGDRRTGVLRHGGATRAVSRSPASPGIAPALFAVTGSSGAGVQPRPDHAPSCAGAQPVRLLGHGTPARGRGADELASLDRRRARRPRG